MRQCNVDILTTLFTAYTPAFGLIYLPNLSILGGMWTILPSCDFFFYSLQHLNSYSVPFPSICVIIIDGQRKWSQSGKHAQEFLEALSFRKCFISSQYISKRLRIAGIWRKSLKQKWGRNKNVHSQRKRDEYFLTLRKKKE